MTLYDRLKWRKEWLKRYREDPPLYYSGPRFTGHPLMTGSGEGITKRPMVLCPARALARHPDPSWRKLGRDQAADFHRLNDIIEHGDADHGPCPARACTNPIKPRKMEFRPYAKKWAAENGPNVLGR